MDVTPPLVICKILVPCYESVKPGFHKVADVAAVARSSENWAQQPQRLYGNKRIYFAGDPPRPWRPSRWDRLSSISATLSDPR